MKAPLLSQCKNSKGIIAKKRKKQNVELHGLETLPDEILIVILSCLTSFKEAVKTSVLSRRWRYLWRFTSGSIELDFDQCIGNCSNRNCYNKAARFLSWVDQVVKLHEGPSVDKFIVRCVHGWSPDRIYYLIRFAMQKEVRVFELNIPYNRFPDLDKFLSISRAVVKPPEDHFGGGLSQLTSLTLVKVNIDNEMMEYLLSNCPFLEHLCIMFVTDVTKLNVVSPSLKSLIVCFCAYLRTLTISATNLVSFEYGDSFDKPISKLKYQFQNVPLLSELKLRGVPCRSLLLWPSWHSEYSHQLERLLLDVPVVVVYGAAFRSRSSFYELPQLRCLKQLELKLHTSAGEGHLFFVMLTTACPLLSRFVVQFLYEKRTSKENRVTDRLNYERVKADFRAHDHQCLKVVELTDFACYKSDFRFASALLQIAKSLDKIIISPGPGYLNTKRISTVRERAKKLEASLPHGAKLVIL